MSFARKLIWAAGIAGVAVGATLRSLARQSARRERRLHGLELQRWEDEGGNPRATVRSLPARGQRH